MSWPDDDDGDVFRSLEKNGFDFDKEYTIDINLDFDHWPLSERELSEIEQLYPGIEVIAPEPGESVGNGVDIGFLQFQIRAKLNYVYMVDLQRSITRKISNYGGWCNSWGVGQW